MLGRCGSTTLLTRNSPLIRRAIRLPKRYTASSSYAAPTGPTPPENFETSSDGRTSLPPSPAFRNCFLPSTQQGSESALLWRLSKLLTEKGDVVQLVKILTGPENPVRTPNVFNALFARLHCLQECIPPAVVLDAMQCAAHDPTALKTLLGLYHDLVLQSSKDPDVQVHEAECVSWFERIAKNILSVQILPIEERTKCQWIWVIAGWDGGLADRSTFPKPPSVREFCLFDLGPRKNHQCWPIYIELLSMHNESRLVANEWQKFVAEDIGNTESFSDMAAFRENLNVTISALIRLGDPGRAWSIAYGAGEVTELVNRENLRRLLAHPECMRSWRPEMNEAALDMLETEIQKLEQFFGLVWQGGQDGFHRVDATFESKKLE